MISLVFICIIKISTIELRVLPPTKQWDQARKIQLERKWSILCIKYCSLKKGFWVLFFDKISWVWSFAWTEAMMVNEWLNNHKPRNYRLQLMFCIFFFSLELIFFSFSSFLGAGFVLYYSCVSCLPVFDSMHQHLLLINGPILLYFKTTEVKVSR